MPLILPDNEDGVGAIEDDDLSSGDDVMTIDEDEDLDDEGIATAS